MGARPTLTATAIVLVLTAMLFATTTVSVASHRPAPLRRCAPRGLHVVLSNVHAQVFQTPTGFYACLRSSSHRVFLGHTEDWAAACQAPADRSVVVPHALAGTVVAYSEWQHSEEAIAVRNIATGRLLHNVALHVATEERTLLEWAESVMVVLKGDGGFAWTQRDSFARHGGGTPPPTVFDVFAVDRAGFRALSIDLPAKPSLTLRGSVLSWTEGSTQRSTLLN